MCGHSQVFFFSPLSFYVTLSICLCLSLCLFKHRWSLQCTDIKVVFYIFSVLLLNRLQPMAISIIPSYCAGIYEKSRNLSVIKKTWAIAPGNLTPYMVKLHVISFYTGKERFDVNNKNDMVTLYSCCIRY